MLKDILEEKKCFKLVCGAGNEDIKEVEKLTAIYSKAGCNFFDVCANLDVVKAAKKGLEKAGIEKDRYLCVSVGIAGDPHITKANINKDKCIKCGNCKEICPHNALSDDISVIKERCLGCSQCKDNCPTEAISMESVLKNYNEILPEIINEGIDCIEFHAISENKKDVFEKWEQLNNLYDGMLCISVDRSGLGDKELINQVKEMVEKRKPYTTIIQADGVAMSGTNDEYGTTLQAVATAQMFQNSKIQSYIMMSGGTNTKSTELTKMFGIKINALAVGSYARKIVKEYLLIENLLDDEEKFNKAVEIAKNLVQTSIENMQND